MLNGEKAVALDDQDPFSYHALAQMHVMTPGNEEPSVGYIDEGINLAKTLKAIEIETYQENGLLFPKRLLTTQEADEYLAELEASRGRDRWSGEWKMALQIQPCLPLG